eukprot:TRINITY_DN6257_c0_g2_i1.p1 TRINITY_DN6257_c0_g2~~TRINITY_DN6257_c0_g2_i1.p1  ORF type:complete len:134 (+),score=24.55 TRINITY_DN6257_c0_g2_i1:426-827(+)
MDSLLACVVSTLVARRFLSRIRSTRADVQGDPVLLDQELSKLLSTQSSFKKSKTLFQILHILFFFRQSLTRKQHDDDYEYMKLLLLHSIPPTNNKMMMPVLYSLESPLSDRDDIVERNSTFCPGTSFGECFDS